MLKAMGHRLAPHIIIGHHFGEIRGEWRALEIISRVGVETIVLVIFKPIVSSEKMPLPHPDDVSRMAAVARVLNPLTPIRMGCIRPAHPSKGRWKKDASTPASTPSLTPFRERSNMRERSVFERDSWRCAAA